ncbi:MAG: lipid-A-disaccharide synthase [Acidobacteriota bacterium]|nr:lipid-A-disaccharide synthase [Acidobacteriota bacterium]
MSSVSLLVVAGEASGDLHGGRLLGELREIEPDLEVFGLGGDEMAEAGFDALAHSREIAVVGIWEALTVVPRARRLLQSILAEVDRRSPAVALLIDSPDFNLRLAGRLKKRGVPVVYYVSPQVWAWRRGRIKTIRDRVQKMLVLFGFEEGLYRPLGVPVVHVGHPLVDEVPVLPHVLDRPASSEPRRVALLPGSRDSEVRRLLPVMLEAVEKLRQRESVEVALIQASTVTPALVEEILASFRVRLDRVTRERFAAVASCHLALCASGTATLEVGLIGTPMIVLYRVAQPTALLARLLIRVEHISLVNLVLGESIVPELLQGAANASAVATRMSSLLRDPDSLREVRNALGRLRPALGESGASRRAAVEVAKVLGEAA